MVRKTREEALKTKENIMDVAKVLFCKKGFDRTNLCDIADEAGVTRGGVYWHFQNKDELFLELWKAMCKYDVSYYSLVSTQKAETGSPLSEMRIWLMSIKEILQDEENVVFLRVIGSIMWGKQGTNRIRKLIEDFDKELKGRISLFIKNAINCGELSKEVNASLASNYAFAVMDGYLKMFIDNKSLDLIEYTEMIINSIMTQLPYFIIKD